MKENIFYRCVIEITTPFGKEIAEEVRKLKTDLNGEKYFSPRYVHEKILIISRI
jgi:hypothetical protein